MIGCRIILVSARVGLDLASFTGGSMQQWLNHFSGCCNTMISLAIFNYKFQRNKVLLASCNILQHIVALQDISTYFHKQTTRFRAPLLVAIQICPYGHMGIWAYVKKIWSSGVSPKKASKMQLRDVVLRSVGHSSQKL